MNKISKPQCSQAEIYSECVSDIRSGLRKNRIISSQKAIKESSEYDEIAEHKKLSDILVHDSIQGGASADDMNWLYTNKFVRGKGRKYYDELMLIPPYGTCPLCGQRKVSTLDHYLPKSLYPKYAITAFNLVAVCSECNTKKGSLDSNHRADELLHPYYDDYDDEIWLKAEISDGREIAFTFLVEKPLAWSAIKHSRIQNHFKKLELNDLYRAHASEEFVGYNFNVKRLYQLGGNKLVKKDLVDRIDEYRCVRKNTWRAAMYEGILNNVWFFDKYLVNL